MRPALRPFLLLLGLVACSAPPAVGSIGAVLGRDPDTDNVFVRETPGSELPDHAALIPGDQIVMVEGVLVKDLTTKQLRVLLRGEPGSEVHLTVARGSEVLRLKVKRTALKSKLLPAKEERVSEE